MKKYASIIFFTVFSTISNKRITKVLHTYMYTYCFFLTYRRSHSSIHFVALLSFSTCFFFSILCKGVFISRNYLFPPRFLRPIPRSNYISFWLTHPFSSYRLRSRLFLRVSCIARVIVHVYTRVDHSRPAFYTPSFTSLTPRIPLPDSPTHNSLLFLSYTNSIYERRGPFACSQIATDSKYYFRSIYYSEYF